MSRVWEFGKVRRVPKEGFISNNYFRDGQASRGDVSTRRWETWRKRKRLGGEWRGVREAGRRGGSKRYC